MTTSPENDAMEAYEGAFELARMLREAWQELGCPSVSHGAKGQLTAHPLLKAINEAESLAARLRQPLLRKHPGPEPRAVVRTRIGTNPAERLRAERLRPAGD